MDPRTGQRTLQTAAYLARQQAVMIFQEEGGGEIHFSCRSKVQKNTDMNSIVVSSRELSYVGKGAREQRGVVNAIYPSCKKLSVQ